MRVRHDGATGIGTPDSIAFAAQYLAYTPPYQRFMYYSRQ